MPDIVYPPGSDHATLLHSFALREYLRREHNRLGQIARDNPAKYMATGKWRRFRSQYDEAIIPALNDGIRFRKVIRNKLEPRGLDRDGKLAFFDQYLYGKGDIRALSNRQLASMVQRISAPCVDWLKTIKLDDLQPLGLLDPYVDWTGWTETDTSGVLTVAANTLTTLNMTRGDDAVVVGDYGAGHFVTGTTHYIDADATEVGNATEYVLYRQCNSPNENYDVTPFLLHDFYTGGKHVYEYDNGVTDDIDISGADTLTFDGRRYYIKITRDNPSVASTWDDARDGTSLIDTLSINQDATTYRYLECARTRAYSSNANETSGHEYDLDLQEAAVTDYPRSASVAVGLAPLSSRALALARSSSPSMGTDLSVSRIANFPRTPSPSLGLATAVSRLANFPRTVSATLGLASRVSRTIAVARSSAASLGLASTASRALVVARSVATSLGLTTAASRALAIARSATVSIGLATTAVRVYGRVRVASVALGLYTVASILEKIKRLVLSIGTNRTTGDVGTNRDVSTTGDNRIVKPRS